MRSVIDAVEKIDLRGRKTQLLPYRCQLDKRAERHEKLLLAYDALCLTSLHRSTYPCGQIGRRA